jgi:hypothetical protein
MKEARDREKCSLGLMSLKSVTQEAHVNKIKLLVTQNAHINTIKLPILSIMSQRHKAEKIGAPSKLYKKLKMLWIHLHTIFMYTQLHFLFHNFSPKMEVRSICRSVTPAFNRPKMYNMSLFT